MSTGRLNDVQPGNTVCPVLSAVVSVLHIGHTDDGVGHSVVNNCIHWREGVILQLSPLGGGDC